MNSITAFLLLIGLLVFVHELGHFLVAKWCGVRVEQFSLGFGPAIIGFTRGETTYKICLLPFGGYVKMTGEEQDAQDPRSFSKKSVPRRMAIITAGPLMNFLLPFVLVPAALMAGIYVPSHIVSEPVIGEVAIGSPAREAGIKAGDRIVSVAGRKTGDWEQVAQMIRKNGGREIDLEVARDGAVFKTSAVPVKFPGSKNAAIGITPRMEKTFKKFGFVESLTMGIERAAAMATQVVSIIFGILFALISGEMSAGFIAGQIAGPLGIAKMSGAMAEQGIASLLIFASFISVNLAVVNLLPIPVLDGGHMVYLTIEAVRKKPLSRATLETAQKIGFSFLIVLMLVATYNDVTNLWDGIAGRLKELADFIR